MMAVNISLSGFAHCVCIGHFAMSVTVQISGKVNVAHVKSIPAVIDASTRRSTVDYLQVDCNFTASNSMYVHAHMYSM